MSAGVGCKEDVGDWNTGLCGGGGVRCVVRGGERFGFSEIEGAGE